MSDKHYVGMDVTGFEDHGALKPVSRVTLMLDDENALTAGDDTGYEILSSCPHATQEMVDTLLSKLRGKVYRMYTAEDAGIDPAAELGDGVTVGGIYSMVSRLSDDGEGYPGISAPGEEELEDEYPSAGPMTREFNRQLAKTRSSITKTAEEIRLEVSGLSDTISVTVDLINGLTVKNANGETVINGGRVDTEDLHVKSANIDGTLTADQINMTGAITWGDLAADVQTTVSNASTAAANASSTVAGWTYPYSTAIDGSKIMTGTVMASKLLGGEVGLLDESQRQIGSITIASTTTGYGLQFTSDYGGIRFGTSGNFWVDCASTFGTNYLGFQHNSTVFPGQGGMYDLGMADRRWRNTYTGTCNATSSDRNAKNSIDYDMSRYEALFSRLKPAWFKYDDGTSGRYHVGYIAQDVEEAMSDAGLTSLDFAGLIKAPGVDDDGNPVEGKYDYLLRYGEFVPLNTWMIQQLEARVARLERSTP